MSDPLTLWLIGDGKPGHENQSLGLAEAMAAIRPCEIHRISVASAGGGFGRLRAACSQARKLPSADVVVAAGHATHLPLLWLSRREGARSVVLMRPSMPLSWFDFCVAPEHDFIGRGESGNLLLTKGAINRVRATGGGGGRLMLIGGPSAAHGWDAAALLHALGQVALGEGWELTDSRRTPAGFLDQVRAALPQVTVVPHQQTAADWLPGKLAAAGEVWVSEDSVSMIYEALSSGARVGLLPLPRKRASSRVLRGIDGLVAADRLRTLARWLECGRQLPAADPLREADRCAAIILERLASA